MMNHIIFVLFTKPKGVADFLIGNRSGGVMAAGPKSSIFQNLHSLKVRQGYVKGNM